MTDQVTVVPGVPGQIDIPIERGDRWSILLYYREEDQTTPIDLTGFSAEILDSQYVAIPSSCSVTNAAGGEITVIMTAADTTALAATKYYRLRIVSGGSITTIMEGRFRVS